MTRPVTGFTLLLALVAGVAAADAADRVVGDLAVIEADATVVQPGELFDLAGRTVTFTPKPGGGYDVTSGPLQLDAGGSHVQIAAGGSYTVPMPFRFPFFDTRYGAASEHGDVVVNANGTVTFGLDAADATRHFNVLSGGSAADLGTVADILDALLVGTPRIAALWQDWTDVQVSVLTASDRVAITWNVRLSGTATSEFSFQAVLLPDGTIRLGYPAVPFTPAGGVMVGISPAAGFATTVDLSHGGTSVFDVPRLEALAQAFGTTARPLVDLQAVTRRLYASHADAFDQVVFFSSFEQSMPGGAFAFEETQNQTVAGIGRQLELDSDVSSLGGSRGQLQSIVNMGWLGEYPGSADGGPLAVIPGLGGNSSVSLVGHETGHMWLASVTYDDMGVCRDDLLGRDLAHWSFFLDSDGSVMEGNDWPDTSGTFTSGPAVRKFSALDQYIMGLRAASEVPSYFHIDLDPLSRVGCYTFGATGLDAERSCAPQSGVTVSGTRRNVTVQQIIACTENGGARNPPSGLTAVTEARGESQKNTWRQAFVLLVVPGADASDDVAKLEAIRAAWVSFFHEATDGRGSVTTALGTPRIAVGGAGEFGGVGVGTSHDLTITIQNVGDGTLEGTAAIAGCAAPCPFSLVSGASFTLAGGASGPVVVRFSPAGLGPSSATIQVSSNGVNDGGAVSHVVTGHGIERFTLTVVTPGTGRATIAGLPPGVDCSAGCSVPLDAGTVVSLTAPAASGSRFDGWSGDCSGTGTCTVTMDGTRTVTARFTAVLPDLRVTAVTIATATVKPRDRLSVSVSVRNDGSPAPSSTLRFYLSRDALPLERGVRLVSSVRIGPLAHGATTSAVARVTVPRWAPPGLHVVVACADDTRRVDEGDAESNNCTPATAPITIVGPDLAVDAIAPRTASVFAGERLTVDVTVRNRTAIAADRSAVRFYLAGQRARSAGDLLLRGTGPVGRLGRQGRFQRSVTVTVSDSTPAGTYYVLACADDLGQVPEIDESNNCLGSEAPVTVE